jgi:two-component system cell cycle sensor histidine kinase/response regulator CckA
MKILLIDDSAAYREEFAVLLNDAGIQDSVLDVASTLTEGARLMALGAHDIYIVDYRLPGGDGLSLVRDARAAGMTAPIILLTGYDSRAVDALAEEAGATDYLSKGDFTPQLLSRAIRYAVRNAAAVKAAQELDAAKADLAAMAAAGPGALYRLAVDAGGTRRIMSLSENFTKLTGFPVAPLLGVGFPIERFDPATLPAPRERSRLAREQGEMNLQYRFQHADGRWIWLLDIAKVVTRRRDGSYDTIGYLTDITHEKEMAAQVAQAGKMAVLGEMATGMAHELNQPLTGISMAAENGLALLSGLGPEAEPARRKLLRITEQALRAGAIIRHMRIFGRREGMAMAPLSLADAVNGAGMILESRLRLEDIALETDLPADLPLVRAGSLQVEQVLVNLLVNACDAYRTADPAMERRIRLSARAEDGRVWLRIADRAGGISDPSRVFEPFYTTKEVGQGTGLGLSISYGIIADLGGHLSVRNEGGGAVFDIDLPVAVGDTVH